MTCKGKVLANTSVQHKEITAITFIGPVSISFFDKNTDRVILFDNVVTLFGCVQPAWLVIPALVAQWVGFQVMNRFAKEARRSRCAADPFQQYENDIAHIEKETSALKDIFPRKTAIFLKKTDISKLLSSPISFNHHDVTIRILECSGFGLKARCLRCQALFRYHVEEEVAELERRYRAYPGIASVNLDLNCAETYAHFYCRACFGSGTRNPTCGQ